ncbi:hypothetical protein KCU86_g16827, partial [Aureobasidium melanogenum]
MSTTVTRPIYESHPSVDASMEDFEFRTNSPEFLRPDSHARIQFMSPTASDYSEAATQPDIDGGWSPPAWRKAGSGWFKHHLQQTGLMSPYGSRECSPEEYRKGLTPYDDDEDILVAAGIPLPISPLKGRSPEPSYSPTVAAVLKQDEDKRRQMGQTQKEGEQSWPDKPDNYIRFSVRADVQQRTEPIEAVIAHFRKLWGRFTKNRYTTFLSLMSALFVLTLTRALFSEPVTGPTPDLVKVAGLAKSFEPLMYYSENGHSQVVQLGETGVAVWDLGESVRSTNMTSGPIIVRELDELSDSLKNLAHELTRFFAGVDGDIDSILIVMEWAQRELTKLNTLPASHMSLAFSNLHSLLSRVGLLEDHRTGEQTAVGKIVAELFGHTAPQVTRATLQRTFTDFLGVLEESINNELTASMSLFAHFEAIDRQFLNLQRVVIRETDAQEREENEALASLWARVIGVNASRLKKFEKNKQLLSSLRERTIQNKHVLVDHNGRLLQLRSNLEILRKKLVSPLVRSNGTSTLTVDEQIKGLEGTYLSLRATREAQKSRLYEIIHDAGTRRVGIVRGPDEGYAIEGR